MEEKNKKKRLLYTLLGVIVLLASVGGAYAFFSASVSNTGNILGQTQNINNNSLRLSVTKVNFNDIDTSVVPSNDLVPAYFGLNNNNQLNVANPSLLDITNVQDMIENKCVNTSEGYTGCHVYKIAISADQNITHVNLLLGLTVNDHSTSDVSIVDKQEWGYVVFTASQNSSTTGVAGSGTQTAIADGAITNLALNSAGHGAPAAIGDGLVSSPTDNRIDIHNNQKLIGCNSAGLPQEVVYYLLVYVNDTDVSQNTSNNGVGDSNYAVGSYSGTLELRALGGKVRADFGPDEATGTLMSRFYDRENFEEPSPAVPIIEPPIVQQYSANDIMASKSKLIFLDNELPSPTIKTNEYYYVPEIGLFGNENITSESIGYVYIVNHTSIPADAIDYWDASEEQNGSVMAWITEVGPNQNYCSVKNYTYSQGTPLYGGIDLYDKEYCDLNIPSYETNFNCDGASYCTATKLYNLYIGQVGGVNANPISTSLFYLFDSVQQIDLSYLNTSNVTNMDYMFYACESLTSLNLSNFDTSNVIDMNNMFFGCESLTSLNLSSFNTTNVTSMYRMFSGCSLITSLNLSSFNTTNVENMEAMFGGCLSLTSLDLSNFDTSNVENMEAMFSYCSSLISLNLGNHFDISNVSYVTWMFDYSDALASISVNPSGESKLCQALMESAGTNDSPYERVSVNGKGNCETIFPPTIVQ